jgi:hypothetical protein
MQSLPVPCSPLSVIYRAIVLCILFGAAMLVTLLFELLTPFWSRTVIVLQGLAVLVALMAYRWRPSWRLVFYPLLLANMAYVWDHTLPPPNLPDGLVRVALPLATVIGIGGDLLMHRRRSLPFMPRRIPVYGGYVNLDEAAHFFRLPPDSVRLHCTSTGRTTAVGRSGDEYIALDDLLIALDAHFGRHKQQERGRS